MKKLASLAACALFAFSLPGAVLAQQSEFGPADATETYYWISNKANLPLFVQYDYVGMERIADELGVKVRVAGPTDFDIPGFIATVDQVCAQKPAGVVVVGWDPSLTESVNTCMDLGVPTVVDDADLPDSRRIAFIGSDWTKMGEAKARLLIETRPEGGKVATLSIINASNMRQAVAGFTSYLEANGGGKFNIVANEDDNGDAAKAAEVTAALLAAHPDLAAVIGFDSESGPGSVRALQESGKAPGDVTVIADEQSSEFFRTVKDGWVEAIMVQNRELFIYYAIRVLYDYNHNGLRSSGLDAAAGGRPVPAAIDTGLFTVNVENVDKVLSALGVAN